MNLEQGGGLKPAAPQDRLPSRPMRCVASFVLLFAACSTAPTAPTPPQPAAPAAASIGSTRETAVEVCKPPGEREYLERLRCPDGSTPESQRLGSYGSRTEIKSVPDAEMAEKQALRGVPVPPGGKDFHVLDKYALRCGDTFTEIFVDMYHCNQPPPSEAPAGFTLAASPRL